MRRVRIRLVIFNRFNTVIKRNVHGDRKLYITELFGPFHCRQRKYHKPVRWLRIKIAMCAVGYICIHYIYMNDCHTFHDERYFTCSLFQSTAWQR